MALLLAQNLLDLERLVRRLKAHQAAISMSPRRTTLKPHQSATGQHDSQPTRQWHTGHSKTQSQNTTCCKPASLAIRRLRHDDQPQHDQQHTMRSGSETDNFLSNPNHDRSFDSAIVHHLNETLHSATRTASSPHHFPRVEFWPRSSRFRIWQQRLDCFGFCIASCS